MQPPRRAPRPNFISSASYWREGKRHARAALRQFPTSHMPEALVKYFAAGGPITAATVLRYTEDCRRLLSVWQRLFHLDSSWFAQKFGEIQNALEGRRIRRRRKRGEKSTPRLATEAEYVALLLELLNRYKKSKDITPVVAGFAVLAIHATGMRPVEMMGAEVRGNAIIIRNAKHKAGQSEFRTIDLFVRSPGLPKAMTTFLAMVQIGIESRFEFNAFRDRLAECVARACDRAKLPRFSLYSFRHLAIAIWTEKGLAAEIIAALAGHFSSLTAARNYARGTNRGWNPESTPMGQLAETVVPDAINDKQRPSAFAVPRPYKFPPIYRPPVLGKKAPETQPAVEIKADEDFSALNRVEVGAQELSSQPAPNYKSGMPPIHEIEILNIKSEQGLWEKYRQHLDDKLSHLRPSRIADHPNTKTTSDETIDGAISPAFKK